MQVDLTADELGAVKFGLYVVARDAERHARKLMDIDFMEKSELSEAVGQDLRNIARAISALQKVWPEMAEIVQQQFALLSSQLHTFIAQKERTAPVEAERLTS